MNIQDYIKAKYKNYTPYALSPYSIEKNIPDNYDELIIPEIERITQYMPGDIIKGKIYNYVIYYYNKGMKSGLLESINIHSGDIVKKIMFDITDKGITLKLIEAELV